MLPKKTNPSLLEATPRHTMRPTKKSNYFLGEIFEISDNLRRGDNIIKHFKIRVIHLSPRQNEDISNEKGSFFAASPLK